jgi:hypothetical protein
MILQTIISKPDSSKIKLVCNYSESFAVNLLTVFKYWQSFQSLHKINFKSKFK